MEDIMIARKSELLLLRLEPSLKSRLIIQAKREGMSAAAIIRMAVRAYLDANAKNGRKR